MVLKDKPKFEHLELNFEQVMISDKVYDSLIPFVQARSYQTNKENYISNDLNFDKKIQVGNGKGEPQMLKTKIIEIS